MELKAAKRSIFPKRDREQTMKRAFSLILVLVMLMSMLETISG